MESLAEKIVVTVCKDNKLHASLWTHPVPGGVSVWEFHACAIPEARGYWLPSSLPYLWRLGGALGIETLMCQVVTTATLTITKKLGFRREGSIAYKELNHGR